MKSWHAQKGHLNNPPPKPGAWPWPSHKSCWPSNSPRVHTPSELSGSLDHSASVPLTHQRNVLVYWWNWWIHLAYENSKFLFHQASGLEWIQILTLRGFHQQRSKICRFFHRDWYFSKKENIRTPPKEPPNILPVPIFRNFGWPRKDWSMADAVNFLFSLYSPFVSSNRNVRQHMWLNR